MTMDTSISLELVTLVAGLAVLWGSLTARLKVLERKVELHNSAMERLAQSEVRQTGAEERLGRLEQRLAQAPAR